ncbi:MAG: TRAP transporter small permease [Chloroflexi bacterium]|nr:TRAP transporter small permease [Chloroflexota bacterium]
MLGAGGWLAGIGIVLVAAVVVYEVVMRYALVRPTTWVVNFTEYSLIYLVFLSVPLVLAKDKHVKLDFLLNSLSPEVQRIANTVTSLVAAVSCAVLFWYGLRITLRALEIHEVLITAIITPKWIVLMPIPLGSFFLVIQFLRRAWSYATKP